MLEADIAEEARPKEEESEGANAKEGKYEGNSILDPPEETKDGTIEEETRDEGKVGDGFISRQETEPVNYSFEEEKPQK